jgi:DEAD/DEAH box helicase domain-containing protein
MSLPAERLTAPAATDAVGRLAGRLQQKYRPRITGELVIPSREGRYAPLPGDLDPRLRRALAARGLQRLYSHQAAAWEAVTAGRHVVVVTPTASGKTLCYNLPVLQAVLSGQAKALYLFPTKALSQDQVAELVELSQAGELGIRAFTFDGDTPGDARKAVRTRGDIVVSNPDMLHQGILPHHTKWAQFFENLQYVVIDELHTYRGVFGSHVANVLRRLRRVCRFYGSEPVFVFASATIANPQELAERRAAGRAPAAAVEPAGGQPGSRHSRLGTIPDDAHRQARDAHGPQEHRVRAQPPHGRGADQVPQGRIRQGPAQAAARRRLPRRLPAHRAPRHRAAAARRRPRPSSSAWTSARSTCAC